MRRLFELGIALACLAAPAAVGAQTAPDDTAREKLRGALATARLVRVTTPTIRTVDRRAEVRDDGVLFTARDGWDTVRLTPVPMSLVTWERLNGLEVKRGLSDRWVYGGAIVGGIVAGLVAASIDDHETRGGNGGTLLFALAGTAGGGALGALYGANQDPWVRVWP